MASAGNQQERHFHQLPVYIPLSLPIPGLLPLDRSLNINIPSRHFPHQTVALDARSLAVLAQVTRPRSTAPHGKTQGTYRERKDKAATEVPPLLQHRGHLAPTPPKTSLVGLRYSTYRPLPFLDFLRFSLQPSRLFFLPPFSLSPTPSLSVCFLLLPPTSTVRQVIILPSALPPPPPGTQQPIPNSHHKLPSRSAAPLARPASSPSPAYRVLRRGCRHRHRHPRPTRLMNRRAMDPSCARFWVF